MPCGLRWRYRCLRQASLSITCTSCISTMFIHFLSVQGGKTTYGHNMKCASPEAMSWGFWYNLNWIVETHRHTSKKSCKWKSQDKWRIAFLDCTEIMRFLCLDFEVDKLNFPKVKLMEPQWCHSASVQEAHRSFLTGWQNATWRLAAWLQGGHVDFNFKFQATVDIEQMHWHWIL